MVSPVINQGLIRFLDPSPGTGEEKHDRFTDRVVDEIVRDGEAFFQATNFMGRRCMRVSVSSWMTDDRDVKRSVAAVERAINATRHSTEAA